MQPEVIANLWTYMGAFLKGQLTYQVGIRLYVATGTDDEKTAMLRTLAAWDFHLAHVFPPSCGTTHLCGIPGVGSMEVKGVMPANAPGMEVMDWFQNAFDAIKTLLPEHPTAGGTRRAPLDLTNLLNVHTPVDVDKDGNMTARTSDPQLARNKPTVATNLWAFEDAKSACVHALAGRAYLLAGRPADVEGVLKNLAANDWLLARRLPVPGSFSTTMGGQAVPGRADASAVSSQQDTLFAPVSKQIEQEIPTKHVDWTKKKTHRYVLPREKLIRRAWLLGEGGKAVEIHSVGDKPAGTRALLPITVQCPGCKSKFRADGKLAGRRGKCPQCSAEIIVPLPEEAPSTFIPIANGATELPKQSANAKPPDIGENRANWDVQQYAQAIANKVTCTTPCEDSGLERHRSYVRTLGQEIDQRWGFEAMQQVWHVIHRAMGPGPCSDLTRIWDGVGQWQK